MKSINLILLSFILIVCFSGSLGYCEGEPRIQGIDPIKNTDKILIIAPHPDDEAIACAGIIQHGLKIGAQVRVLYLTNGDHNQLAFIVYEKRLTFRKGEFIHMGEVRRTEAIKAMKLLGLNEQQLIFLGYPDFGTFAIFRNFWQTDKPYRSILTRVSHVPYKENFSFGASYTGESILKDIEDVLSEYKPNKIFVSHPLDINSDHRAAYLFLEIALADLNTALSAPKIYPYLIHWKSWPLPRGYHPQNRLSIPQDLNGSQIRWISYDLTASESDKKHKAILCYKSQTESSGVYLLSFARNNELFGYYPEIDIEAGLLEKNDCPFDYSVEDDEFVIGIKKQREHNNRFGVMIYLFGYSYETGFAQMPKIRIITRHKRLKVFDGKRLLKQQSVSLELNQEEFILRVPFVLLGNPDFILASIKANPSILCADAVGFRKVNIKEGE